MLIKKADLFLLTIYLTIYHVFQRSGIIITILEKGYRRNICAKLFSKKASTYGQEDF